jgi:hypothetical protein
VETIQKKYGTKFDHGSSTNVLYAAAGGSDDWAKGTANIKYSYTLELRDTGAYGMKFSLVLICKELIQYARKKTICTY